MACWARAASEKWPTAASRCVLMMPLHFPAESRRKGRGRAVGTRVRAARNQANVWQHSAFVGGGSCQWLTWRARRCCHLFSHSHLYLFGFYGWCIACSPCYFQMATWRALRFRNQKKYGFFEFLWWLFNDLCPRKQLRGRVRAHRDVVWCHGAHVALSSAA